MINKSRIITFFMTLSVMTCVYGSGTPSPESSPLAPPSGEQQGANQEYSPAAREYHLKAAFLRYVAKFVEWPSNSISGGVINICVLGLVPAFDALNSINGKTVDDRTLSVTKVTNVNEAQGHCQILFITKTESDNVKQIIDAVQNLPVLAFGDMEHFAEQGGDMNFYIMNNRLAIMINPPAVEKSQLRINPRMLRLVTVIPPVAGTKTTTPP